MNHRPFQRTIRIRQTDRDLEEELAFHFEEVIRELESGGLSRTEAEAEARRRFGDEARYRHELIGIDRDFARQLRWHDRLGALGDAIKYAWRSMSYAPGLSVGIVVAFALGIGANATVFNVIDRLLLRPPPQLHDPGSLRVYTAQFYAPALGRDYFQPVRSYPDLGDLSGARALAGSAGYYFSTRDLTIGRGDEARRAKGMMVSGAYFGVLGVAPQIGRLIMAEDDRAGVERVVMLSHGYWQRQYAGSRDAIGQTIDFGQGPHTIIGVLPKGFAGIDMVPVDLWLPIVPYRSAIDQAGWQQSRSNQWLRIVVRLAPGVTVEAAETELTTKFRTIYAAPIGLLEYPRNTRVALTSLIPGRSPLAPAEVNVARWLVLMSLALLIIASLNISNLLLARAIREQRALGIRLALGITRTRMIGQSLLEVVLFALLGGAAALLIARYGGRVIQRIFLPDYAWDTIGFSSRVAWVTAAIAVFAGVAAAVLPGLQMARSDVLSSLRASASSIAGGRARLRTTLVVVQVALSVVLLIGAALFVRSFRNAADADLGIDPDHAWFIRLVIDEGLVDRNRAYSDLAAALARVPDITAAGAASTLPFFNRHGTAFNVEGWDSVPGRVYFHSVAGDYFKALDLGLLAGRLLDAADAAGSEPAGVVNEEFARRLFPKGAIGRCLYVGQNTTNCTRIVGVVETARLSGVRAEPSMQFYIAAAQHPTRADLETLVIRLADNADRARVLTDVRQLISDGQPRVRYIETTALRDQLEPEMRPWRLGAVLFTTFGILALILATLGLYAVVSFDVSQQMRELGLRSALGATSSRLLIAVLLRAGAIAALGAAAGALIAWNLAPRFQDQVFAISPRDPLSLTVVCIALPAVALVSALIPALRASRASPVVLIRGQS
ncbi:MAG: ABC transporter permease [Gemmatimonadota bacterium]